MKGETYFGEPCIHGHSGNRYVKGGRCVECAIIRDARRRQTPEEKAKRNAYASKYNSRPDIKARTTEQRRATKYGVTPTMFNFTLAGQNFCCGKCGADSPGTKHDWHTDHCHDTGRFRGILCNSCNTGLGQLGDNVAGLIEGIEYLVGEPLPTILKRQILRMAGRANLSLLIAPNAKPQPNSPAVSSSPSSSALSRKSVC